MKHKKIFSGQKDPKRVTKRAPITINDLIEEKHSPARTLDNYSTISNFHTCKSPTFVTSVANWLYDPTSTQKLGNLAHLVP